MQLETVLYEVGDCIATISLNRPEVLNAQNRQLVSDFLTALKEAEVDADVKVVIVKGEGRAFCAGDDLNEEMEFSMEQGFNVIETMHDTTRAIMRMPKPVIAAVHGYALGAGCEWAMNCDIRIAAEGAKFGFPETSVGMAVTNAGTKLLPLLIGFSRAKELVFTGERIDASLACEWGLVNKVVPIAELETAAREMAVRIMQNSALAVALAKKSLNQGVVLGFEETMRQESHDIMLIMQTLEASLRAQKGLGKGDK